MHEKLWRLLVIFGLFLGSSSLSGPCCAQAQSPARQPAKVPEVYFGVIEPPVVAQQDITVRATTSNQQLEEKPLECSGLAWIDGNLLISSDRHNHLIFTCPIDTKKMTIGQPTPQIIIGNEQELLEDAECITLRRNKNGRRFVYMMCSLSNDPTELPLPKRRHMLRTRVRSLEPFKTTRQFVLNAGTIRESINGYFKKIGVEPYRTFSATFTGPDKNTYRWGNIEGLCHTPDGSALLIGMRNPLAGSRAILAVVKDVDEAFREMTPESMQVTDMFTLNLGDRGISDLCWDTLTKGYLIAAAKSNGPKLNKDQPFPPNTLDSALFWWSGRKSEDPILFAKFPDLKVEAICRLSPSRFIAVGSDEADLSEGRARQQQSILTVLYFTGVEPKSGK